MVVAQASAGPGYGSLGGLGAHPTYAGNEKCPGEKGAAATATMGKIPISNAGSDGHISASSHACRGRTLGEIEWLWCHGDFIGHDRLAAEERATCTCIPALCLFGLARHIKHRQEACSVAISCGGLVNSVTGPISRLALSITMSTMTTPAVAPVDVATGFENDEPSDIPSYQDISGRNINPAKLTALLRSKFGIGSYEIHV